MALFRIGAGAISEDQIAQIYEQEKHMFVKGSECLLKDNARRLCYDSDTDKYCILTDTTVDEFIGLTRVDSNAISGALSASLSFVSSINDRQGIVTGSGVYFNSPGYNITNELDKKNEQLAIAYSPPVAVSWTGTAHEFPVGYEPFGIIVNTATGAVETEEDYTVSFNGFRYTVTPSGSSDWLMYCRRK